MDTTYCLLPVVTRFGVFPCGKCPVCRMKYRKQMALRIYMEKCIEKPVYSYFMTLTYNDENIPTYNDRKCFNKEHLTTFFDSLRHSLRSRGYSLRYFLTCEYGEEGYRPHYHFLALLYGLDGKRERFLRHSFNHLCQTLWQFGYTYDGTIPLPNLVSAKSPKA